MRLSHNVGLKLKSATLSGIEVRPQEAFHNLGQKLRGWRENPGGRGRSARPGKTGSETRRRETRERSECVQNPVRPDEPL